MKLVVDRPHVRTPHVDETEDEKLAECQGILVRAAKARPRRVVVLADLDDGAMAVWSSGMTRREREAFTDSGLALLFPGPR